MAPPPSQAGKFKPRKPPKKIKPGATVSKEASTSAETSSAAPKSSAQSTGSSRGRGSGRGGRSGRGRSSGRGGGRRRGSPISIPRGEVYFTGDQTKPASAKPKTPGARPASTAKQSGSNTSATKSAAKSKGVKVEKGVDTTEIVVGELDAAIGSTAESKPKATARKREISDKQNKDKRDFSVPTKTASATLNEYYDSDSSLEEQQQTKRVSTSFLPPAQLPFPVPQVPHGIGEGPEGRALYDCQTIPDGHTHETRQQSDDREQQEVTSNYQNVSPFCNLENVQKEKDSWFLFQFPTRLPLLPARAPGSGSVGEGVPDIVTSNLTADNVLSMDMDPLLNPSGALPTNPPTVPNAFDDSLSGAGAGRFGKILVYKSGKTVMVMGGGADGSPEIRMNVSEGLSCGFFQQAVAIDVDQDHFVPLGEVKKTAVVTPDVDGAFQQSA